MDDRLFGREQGTHDEKDTETAEKGLSAEAEADGKPTENSQAELVSDANEPVKIIGLTSKEVAERVAEGKVNGDQNIKTKSVAQIIRTNTLTFFNFLFIGFAALIIIFNLGLSELAFMGVVLVNLFIGIFQELKAKKTIDKLSLLSAPKVKALRDGAETDIALKDIVLDDVIGLETGNQICADAVVIDGTIEVNESQLTGEPDAITKRVGDELFSGSFVVSGRATSRVIRVGKDNYATKISSGAKYIKKCNSQILNSLMRFIKLMTIIIVPLGAALLCVKQFVYKGVFSDSLLDTITVMIGMIPSGLVMLTSAVFCVSIIRLSKHKALAQDLYAAEALARVDVLCLDKTGTITEGCMEVTELVSVGATAEEMRQIVKDTVTAIDDNNPTANAMKDYTNDLGTSAEATSVIPFSSARKWSGANFGEVGYAIGAAEFVFKNADETMKEMIAVNSAKGSRVLVLAKCSKIENNELPEDVTLLGYVLISDKIRKEAPDTLRFFAEQGVTIKIISGDNPVTVKSIAERAGLADFENYVDASTLTDEDIPEAVEKYTIFGRVTPDQKLAFVKALKAKKHTVAMTGDGVNDVLALKESDCSVAMAAGSDAAKNVSQVVLLDSNFASMPKIVAEGRRSINNLERSASLYLVKTFYSLLVAITFIFLKADLPYSNINLTLLSGLTVGLPSFVLALEPNNELVKGKFLDKIIARALPGSACIYLVILVMTLLNKYVPALNSAFEPLSYSFNSTCLIAMAFVSFMYLFRTSWPFNKIRVIMFALMVAVFALAFVISPFVEVLFNGKISLKLASSFPIESLYLALPVAAVTVPIFLLLNRATRNLAEKNLVDKFLLKLRIK